MSCGVTVGSKERRGEAAGRTERAGHAEPVSRATLESASVDDGGAPSSGRVSGVREGARRRIPARAVGDARRIGRTGEAEIATAAGFAARWRISARAEEAGGFLSAVLIPRVSAR